MVGMDGNIHHVRFPANRLGADIAHHGIPVHSNEPQRQVVSQLRSHAFFAPGIGKAQLFQRRHLGNMDCIHFNKAYHFASYQLFPNFASAVSGTSSAATRFISRLTSAATC